MTTMKSKILTILSVFMFSNGWAIEDDPPIKFPTFEEVDADHNGIISRDEGFRNEYLLKNWEKVDENNNEEVDREEFKRLKPVTRKTEEQKTDHPDAVQQYENGKYISPEKQIERNLREEEK
jgi:hypothetical protein